MTRILLLAGLLSFAAAANEPITVRSGATQTAVVELYTSEGCSSCPPADRWLSRLVETPRRDLDVLALAFHVDYWDYLGWKDRFSSAANTRRQRQLGVNNRQRTIYTPEFFVNGKEARGSGNVLERIQQANRQAAAFDLELTVSLDRSELLLELRSTVTPGESVHHRYLVYENNLSTDVKRGENQGRNLQHQAVVRYMSDAKLLRAENRYRVAIGPDWNTANIGVAVVATSPGSLDYLQAVHTSVADLLARN